MDFIRAVALDDIRIRSGGTGRTVEAYAAIFDEPAEIMDADGHYYEVNHPTSFARSIAHHQGGFPVVYNHGMTIAGTPSTAAACRSACRKRSGSTSGAC
jgi:phage head maturation protease